jgi:hypothetical protein
VIPLASDTRIANTARNSVRRMCDDFTMALWLVFRPDQDAVFIELTTVFPYQNVTPSCT